VANSQDNSNELTTTNVHPAVGGPSQGQRAVGPRRASEHGPRSAAPIGQSASGSADEPPVRFLGDEPELYLQFNRVLMVSVGRAVAGQREDIEDACAFAWVQFLRYQPERDRNWQGLDVPDGPA
jgi:hypothetical protein